MKEKVRYHLIKVVQAISPIEEDSASEKVRLVRALDVFLMDISNNGLEHFLFYDYRFAKFLHGASSLHGFDEVRDALDQVLAILGLEEFVENIDEDLVEEKEDEFGDLYFAINKQGDRIMTKMLDFIRLNESEFRYLKERVSVSWSHLFEK